MEAEAEALKFFFTKWKRKRKRHHSLPLPKHWPPSALFYHFSFRNGKRSRKTIRIRHQEKMESSFEFYNVVFGELMAFRANDLGFQRFLMRSSRRKLYLQQPIVHRLMRDIEPAIQKSSQDQKGNFETGAEKTRS